MATYREFYEETRRRRRQRTLRRVLALVVTAAVILALAWVIVKIIEPQEPEVGGVPADPAAAEQQDAAQSGSDAQPALQESVLAPLPMQDMTPRDQSWNTVGPVEQTLDYTISAPDYRLISLPENGVVDLTYFNTATFLGDSITQSFDAYLPGVLGAKMVASRGVGPKTVVDGTAVALHQGGEPVNMLDTVVDSQPDNVYVLMGANTLVNTGNDDQFLAYYGKMLDMLKERLDPRVRVYVQAIMPVRPEVVQQKAGLENGRLRAINNSLAALALEKGCLFLDLQEVFADADGNMREDFAAPDGIHLNKQGTQAWLDYLCSHTAYDKRNPYLYGSPYYIEQ